MSIAEVYSIPTHIHAICAEYLLRPAVWGHLWSEDWSSCKHKPTKGRCANSQQCRAEPTTDTKPIISNLYCLARLCTKVPRAYRPGALSNTSRNSALLVLDMPETPLPDGTCTSSHQLISTTASRSKLIKAPVSWCPLCLEAIFLLEQTH